jgi:hypothetical protein
MIGKHEPAGNNRTSAAKAASWRDVYGTAEATCPSYKKMSLEKTLIWTSLKLRQSCPN